MKPLRTVDTIAHTLLLLGTVHYITEGLSKAKDQRKAEPTNTNKLYLGLLAVAAVYRVGRLIGPKTPEEKRAARLTHLYDQASSYRKRAELYRNTAEGLLKRSLHNLKAVTAK